MSKNRQRPDVAQLLKAVEEIAPFHLAEDWDNVGLQTGRHQQRIRRVLVALEVTPAVLDEAEALGVEAIVSHHPLIFRPLSSLAESNPQTRLVARLIRAEIAMIAAHTNLDCVPDGTNGEMADRLKLRDRRILFPEPNRAANLKFVVFTPKSHVDAVIDAIASCSAGVIGNYSHCTFRSPGTGTFKALEGSNPFVGSVGSLTEANDEVRLETVCPRHKFAHLLRAITEAHPYEEPAWDAYPLEPTPSPQVGFGLAGSLPKPTTLKAFVSACKRAFGVKSVGALGDEERNIQTAAVFSGSGGMAAGRWRSNLADVLVTGEMTHHHLAEMRDRGGAAVLIGHHASEVIVCPRLARMLSGTESLANVDVDFIVSKNDAAPVRRA